MLIAEAPRRFAVATASMKGCQLLSPVSLAAVAPMPTSKMLQSGQAALIISMSRPVSPSAPVSTEAGSVLNAVPVSESTCAKHAVVPAPPGTPEQRGNVGSWYAAR